MAIARLTSPYSITSTLPFQTRTNQRFLSSSSYSLRFPYPTFSCFLAVSSPFSMSGSHEAFASVLNPTGKTRSPGVQAVVDEEAVAALTPLMEENNEDSSSTDSKVRVRPCQLYVCNLPRSCDISDLLDMFKPYGTVQSVEVSRNVETGISRGCGHVTMSSINEAKAAISVLDGSDVGGREMRVLLSVDTNSGGKNLVALNSVARRNIIFESPYKIYVGNLAWSVKPEDLREHFSQFGTVLSTRLLYDRKAGRRRVYGFLSFSSALERDAAISSSGMEFHGRTLLVREGLRRSES
ncbi:33 kDa ribonucleoprotein, chloroplastic [Telopea speciosissima]|uniref:33 kDa ribonucleoprotein, chloroplastic n=1 Tax=Telopea speciosissima TaxID=54955 RepID=UPI001CC58071|nr:33 kDa ribonucleoprotein, chloroplastic [Telopea speciosissima]